MNHDKMRNSPEMVLRRRRLNRLKSLTAKNRSSTSKSTSQQPVPLEPDARLFIPTNGIIPTNDVMATNGRELYQPVPNLEELYAEEEINILKAKSKFSFAKSDFLYFSFQLLTSL